MQVREGTIVTSRKIMGIFGRLGLLSVRIAIVSYCPVSTCKQVPMEYICLIFKKKNFLIQVCGFIILRFTVSVNSSKMFPVTLTELLHIATLLRFMIIYIHSFEFLILFHSYEKKSSLFTLHIACLSSLLSQFLVMLYSKIILFSRYPSHLDDIIKWNFF